VLGLRLFYVQIIQSPHLLTIADRQYNVELKLPPKRGAVYDVRMVELASSVNVYSAFAESRRIKNKYKLAKKISKILSLPHEKVYKKLKKHKLFVWLKRQITENESNQIKALNNRYVQMVKEPKRFYPSGMLASHVIGFVNIDGKGLEGLELLYNDYLQGVSGRQSIQRDAKRRLIPSLEYNFESALDGHSIVLTIDQVIQYICERELEEVVRKSNAKAGTIVVMEPQTGKILAMANRPNYNINSFSISTYAQRKNRAITDCYEPGSTFKAITAAACLNDGLVKPSEKFYCENGEYKFYGRILHDHKPHGRLSFKEIIQVSSNIGVCKAAQKIGKKRLINYIKAFGFGTKTKVDMPGEVSGILRPLSSWSKIAISSIPMGQGIAVTPLQMMCAFSTIANGGQLVRPYVVDRIVNDKWELIKKFKPQIVRRVISEDTSTLMREFLENVVNKGTGRRAQIKGLKVAGKTGTAQKLEENRTYSHSKFVASFYGFVPTNNPKLVIGVIVDEPKPVYYGGVIAAPVFKRVAEDSLKYLKSSEFGIRSSE